MKNILIECSDWQIDKLIKKKRNGDWLKNCFRKNIHYYRIE